MRAAARAMLGAGALASLGCGQILGIEQRHFDPSLAPGCSTTFDCRAALGEGSFCDAAQCTATPPADEHCRLLEPVESGSLGAIDWAADRPLVVGTLFRVANAGEQPRLESMRLAVREVNTNGGVGAGRKLAMVVCDYGGADGVAEGAEQAALIEGGVDLLGARLSAPVIIAGSSSAVTQQALDRILTRRYPVAFVSSFSTSTQLTKYPDKLSPDDPVGLLWRTAPDDSAQADVLGRLIDAEPGISKLAIVYVDDAYGAPLQQGVKVALGALGSSMATSVHPFGDGTDFATLMAEVFDQAAPPDAMLFIGVDGHQVVEAYQALVDSGHAPAIHAHFLADAAKDKTTLFDPTLPSAVRDIIRSAKGTAPFHSTAPHYDTFAVNLETEFGVDAEGFSFLAHSYDAAYLAAYGLVWADASDRALDGVGVAEGFARLEDGEVLPVGRATWPAAVTALTTGSPADRQLDIDGTSGPLDFDPATGNAPGPIEIWRPDSALDHFQTCASCQPGDAACDLSACFEQ